MELIAIAVGAVLGGLAIRWFARRNGRGIAGSLASSGRIDPFTIGEPWRRHVSAAQSAQRRFAALVGSTDDGPLKDRLRSIGTQVERGVVECFEIAQRGDRLDEVIRTLNGTSLRQQLERTTDAAVRSSLDAQLASLQRIRDQRNATDERLRALHTRLGELVTQAAEVTTGIDNTADLGSAIDDVVQQLEALRMAVDEVTGTGQPGTSQPGTSQPGTGDTASPQTGTSEPST